MNEGHMHSGRKLRRNGTIAGIILVLILLLLWWLLRPVAPDIRELLVQSRDYYEEPYEDIAALAQALETPEAALGFARDRVGLSFYGGRLQTPDEVLRTRVANPADKAMFLAAVLSAMDLKLNAKAGPFPDEERFGLVDRFAVDEKPLPQPLRVLMGQIGYDGADMDTFAREQASIALQGLQAARDLADEAVEKAGRLMDLEGRSALQPVYLDWVWLEDSDGRVYDPVLPDRARPELYRAYGEVAPNTSIELSAVNAFGEVRPMLNWEGAAYGEPISLRFFPMINTAERLAGDPDMSDVDIWAPVLSVGADRVIGAAVNKEGDVTPKALIADLIEGGERPEFSAPPVNSLKLRAVDTSAWPRVKLELSAVVDGTPRWQSAHFAVTLAESQPTIRIDQPLTGQKSLILLADQSGSTLENGIHRWVQSFGQGLIDGLDESQRLAVATFGDQPFFYKLFEEGVPKYGPADVYAQLWTDPVRGQVDFITALDHALNAIVIELGATPEVETEIILVTDGRAGRTKDDEWREELVKLTERSKLLNAVVTPVVMGAAGEAELEELALETGGRIINITQETAIASRAAALASELAGRMVISFRMPTTPVFTTGQIVPFTLDLEGFDGQIKSNVTVPETGPHREPGLYLTVSSGGKITTRPLVALGAKFAYQRMAGDYRVLLAAGRYESNRTLAARLEDWISYYDAKNGDYEALRLAAETPRLSSGEIETVNGLATAIRFAMGAGQELRLPMVAISRQFLSGDAEDRVVISELDMPAWTPLTSHTARRTAVARAGFAVGIAEAQMIGQGTNTVRDFVEAAPVPVSEDEGAAALIANSSLIAGTDSTLFHDPAKPNLYWHGRSSTGQWRGFGIWDDLPLKGSRDVETAAHFNRIQSALNLYQFGVDKSTGMAASLTGASGGGAGPATVALAGFLAFKSEEMKLWCYSSVMLGYVNENIAGEEDAILDKSTGAAEARAAKLCNMDGGPEGFAERAFAEALKAFVDAWANQFEIPQEEVPEIFTDPTANLRDAYDKAERIYANYYPDGGKEDRRDQVEKFIDAVREYHDLDAEGDKSLQTQFVDLAFKWGQASDSPQFQEDLRGAIVSGVE